MWTLVLTGSALATWMALGHWRARKLTAAWTAIAIALLIDQLTTAPNAVAARTLAVRPAVWLGRLSYSLDRWQELFCNRNATTWWTRFPTNIALAVTFAALSYDAIERPALAWRDRVRHARY